MRRVVLMTAANLEKIERNAKTETRRRSIKSWEGLKAGHKLKAKLEYMRNDPRDVPIELTHDVVTEWLQDITDDAIFREGYPHDPNEIGISGVPTPREWFIELWDSINPKFPFSMPQEVAVIRFRKRDPWSKSPNTPSSTT